jgi:FKBP-type peptidyl-prolyl cis-trans isomerase FklB
MMKAKWILVLGVGLMAAEANAQQPTTLPTDKELMSYAVGVSYGRNLKRQGPGKLDIEMLLKGLRDEFSNQPLLVSEEDFRRILHIYEQQSIAMQGKARQMAAWDNKQAGDAFLAENAKREGVMTLPSGLQYKILTAGAGEIPTDDDIVTCDYRGTLIDGIEFDNTHRRGQPAAFEIKKAIVGWREALKRMPVGSKWQIFVPPELGYAKQGAGQYIGPNATLIFELELLSIRKKS